MRRRIATTLNVAVVLPLLVAANFTTQIVLAPSATAGETYNSVTYYGNSYWSATWTPPTGTTRIRLVMVGGGGGYGGLDGSNWYVSPSSAGYVVTDYFTPRNIDIYPGTSGSGGANGASGWGGGAGGRGYFGAGGYGGAAGNRGSSGGGGGGGGASAAYVHGYGWVVAGGAGGGGGAVGGVGNQWWMAGNNGTYSTGGGNGGGGGTPWGADGSGGGGGGGGWNGSYGGGYAWVGGNWGEYAGYGGYRGNNGSSVPVTTNTTTWNANNQGYVQVQYYVANAPAAPGTPWVTAQSNGAVSIAWNAPTDNGGMAVTNYSIERSTNASTWTSCATTGTTTSGTCSGLTNGTTYYWRVVPYNARGWGTPSGYVAGMPRTVPSTPAAPTISSLGDRSATLTWTALSHPTQTGGLAPTYYVQYSTAATDARSWTTYSSTAGTSMTVSGLTNGAQYRFRLLASQAAGNSGYSAESAEAVPRGTPAAPTNLAVTASGDASLTYGWTAPSNTGGLAITDYVVQFYDARLGYWQTFNDGVSANTSVTVTGLSNGYTTYVQVAAKNAAGLQSSFVAYVGGVPRTTPSAPQSLAPTLPSCSAGSQTQACSGSINLSWAAPANNGGSGVTGYRVQYRPAADADAWTVFGGTVTTTSVTVTGLANGTPYVFRVSAMNAAGQGPFTSDSSQLTPRTTPGAPTNVNVTGVGDARASISWTAPDSDGGAAVTNYRLYYRVSTTSVWTLYASAVSATSYTFTGLGNGSTYFFKVEAYNGANYGEGAPTTIGAVPRSVPGTVSATIASQDRALQVTLGAIANGGAALTDVQYSLDGGSTWRTAGVTSGLFTINGLTNGTNYSLRFRAVNASGIGPVSGSYSATPYTTPQAPTNVRVTTTGTGYVNLAWAAPSNNGGNPVNQYRIDRRSAAVGATTAGDWAVYVTLNSGYSSYTVSGLSNGVLYDFRITAINAAGAGVASADVQGTPKSVPGAPTLSTTVTPGDKTLTVTWTAAAANGAEITNYVVQYYSYALGRWSSLSLDGDAREATLTNLINGSTYYIYVYAVNAAGTGSGSGGVSAYPHTAPSAPLGLVATKGTNRINVSWSAPASNGGSGITGYLVQYATSNAAGAQWTTAAELNGYSHSITGLTAQQTYYVRVIAKNAAGNGPAATSGALVPYGVAAAPTNLVAVAGNGKATITFSGYNLNNGGSAITGFRIVAQAQNSGGAWVDAQSLSCTVPFSDANDLSCTITGLQNKWNYRFVGYSINAAGQSAASNASNVVVPGQLPQSISVATFNTWYAAKGLRVGDPAGAIDAVATSGLPVTYQLLSGSTGCVLVGNSYTEQITKGLVAAQTAGTCKIRVSQSGANSEYAAADSVDLSFVIKATAPSAPRLNGTWVANAGKIGVGWYAPVNNGGSAVTKYEVVASQGGTVKASVVVAYGYYASTELAVPSAGTYDIVVYAYNHDPATGELKSVASATSQVTAYGTPGAPSNVTAQTGDRSLVVGWSANANTGGTPLVGFTATAVSSNGGAGGTCYAGAAATSCTITGLTNDRMYTVSVTQRNNYLASAATTVGGVIAGALTQTITFTAAASPRAFSAGNLWVRANASSGIPVVYSSTTGAVCTVNSATGYVNVLAAGECIIKALQDGVGNGYASAEATQAIVIEKVAPGAPVLKSVISANSGSLTAAWTAPTATGGAPLTGAIVTLKAGGQVVETVTVAAGATSHTFTNLANNEYYVSVQVTNGVDSAASNEILYALVLAPAVPVIETVTTAARALVVEWAAVTDTGGAALTGYTVTAYNAGGQAAGTCSTNGTATTCTISGLLNDASYTVKVKAANRYLASAESAGRTGIAGNIAQTVAFAQNTVTSKSFTDAPFTVSATASSNLPVSYASSNVNICAVNASTGLVTIGSLAGDCTITATQSGLNNAYAAAETSTVIAIAQVAPVMPTFTFGVATSLETSTVTNTETTTVTFSVNVSTPVHIGGAATATYALIVDGGEPIACAGLTCTATGYTFTDVSRDFNVQVAITTAGFAETTTAMTVAVYRPSPESPQPVTVTMVDGSPLSAKVVWTEPQSPGTGSDGTTLSTIASYTVTWQQIGVSTAAATLATQGSGAVQVAMPSSMMLTSGSFTDIATSGITPAVSGFAADANVVVTVIATNATVKIATTTGLAALTGYSSTDWTSGTQSVIAFGGTQAEVNAALATLAAKAAASGTPSIEVSAVLGGSAYNPSTGHYYEVVGVTSGIDWASAKTAAEARRFNGLTGYLTTITSAEENAFIVGKVSANGWIGASDANAYTGGPEGDWKWVTGPLSEQQVFWRGGANGAGGAVVDGRYANWASGEPNNHPHVGCGSEDFGQFYSGGSNPGSWNDLPCGAVTAGTQLTYIVEYGGLGEVATYSGKATLGASTQSASISGSITLTDTATLNTVLANLAADSVYRITVTATNAADRSATTGATYRTPTLPSAPRVPYAVAGNTSAELAWQVPVSNGRTVITGYRIEYKAVTDMTWSQATVGNVTAATIPGLTNGVTYEFVVKAINGVGTSAGTAAVTAVPFTVPNAVTNVTATVDANAVGTASVSWTSPATNGGRDILRYHVNVVDTATAQTVAECDPLFGTNTCTFTALPRGTYNAVVTAINIGGASTSATTATAFTIVKTQTIEFFVGTGTTSNTAVTTLTRNYGEPAMVLTSRASSGAAVTMQVTQDSQAYCTLTGQLLTINNYTASGPSQTCVLVANVAGDTVYAPATAELTLTINAIRPSAPQNVTATPGDGSAAISWTAPLSTGGATIETYTVTATASSTGVVHNATVLAASGTAASFPTLNNGETYTVTVGADNGVTVGTMALSDAVTVNPRRVPVAVASVTATNPVGQIGKVNVAWPALPADLLLNGGAPILSYTATLTKTSTGAEAGSCTIAGDAAATECTIAGVVQGDYTVTVAARNELGIGDTRTANVTVGQLQTIEFRNESGTAVTSFTAVKGTPAPRLIAVSSQGLQVTFAVASGGDICSIDSNGVLSIAESFTVAAGVTSVPCQITASAIGDDIYSPKTETITVNVEPGNPTEPMNVVLVPGSGSVTISFTAPTDNGGSPIASYRIEYTRYFDADGHGDFTRVGATPTISAGAADIAVGNLMVNETGTYTVVIGAGNSIFGGITLLNGYEYAVRALAINDAGKIGEWDPISTPSGTPLPVRYDPATVAVAGDRKVTVTWQAPIDSTVGTGDDAVTYFGDGGSTILGYTVTATQGNDTYICNVDPGATVDTLLVCDITVAQNKVPVTVKIAVTNANGSTESTVATSVIPFETQTVTVLDGTTSVGGSTVTVQYGSTKTFNATASSGLAVDVVTTTPTLCSITGGGLLTGLAAGSCVLQFGQAGDVIYNAAETMTVTVDIRVKVAPETVTVSAIGNLGASLATPAVWGGADISTTFEVYTDAALTNLQDTLNAGILTNAGDGTANETATVTGLAPNTTYWVLSTQTSGGVTVSSAAVSFTTLKTPVITSEPANPVALTPYSLLLAADPTTGTGTFSNWEVTNLPAGLTADASTGVISGTPTTIETKTVTVTVTDNGGNTGTSTFTLVVQRASQGLALEAITTQTYRTTTVPMLASIASGEPLTYSSSTPSICTVDSLGAVTLLREGSCTVAVSVAETGVYAADTKSATFTVVRADQTINFATPEARTFGDDAFLLTASATSGGTVTFTVQGGSSSVCSLSGTNGETVTITGAGSCVIVASQVPAGDAADQYNAAPQVARTLVVNKARPTIVLTSASSIGYNETLTVTADIAGNGTLSVALPAGTTALQLTGAPNVIKGLIGSGTATIILQAAESANYLAETAMVTLTLGRAVQTITFAEFETRTYTPETLTLTAASSSGLAVSYVSTDPSVATVQQENGVWKLAVKGVGSTVIKADQSGNDDYYAPAVQVARTLVIEKASQTVAITSSLADRVFGVESSTVTTTNSIAGRTVGVASLTPAVCEITEDGKLNVVGVGTCTVRAANDGDTNYLAASQTYSFAVTRQPRSLTVDPRETTTVFNDGTLNVTSVASLSDGDAKTYTVTSGPCTIAGTVVTPTGAGTCVIMATVVQSSNYLAQSETITVTVLKDDQDITAVVRDYEVLRLNSPALPAGATAWTVETMTVLNADLGIGDTVTVLSATGDDGPVRETVKTDVVGRIISVGVAAGATVEGSAELAVLEKSIKYLETQTIRVTPGPSTAPIVFAVTADSAGICTISGSSETATITAVGVGTCTVTIDQAGDDNYNAAPRIVEVLRIGRTNQTIEVATIDALQYGDDPVEPAVEVEAGTDPVIRSTNEDIVKVEDGKLVPTGVGTAEIVVTAPGTALYNDAPAVVQIVTVDKGDQTIVVSAKNAATEGEKLDIEGSARSDLPVAYSSATPNICAVEGATVQLKAAGKCQIVADQDGNHLWNAAPSVVLLIESLARPRDQVAVWGSAWTHVVAMSNQGAGRTLSADLYALSFFDGRELSIVGALPKGVASATIENGRITVVAEKGYSGRPNLQIMSLKGGVSETVTVNLVVNPQTPAAITYVPRTVASSIVKWSASDGARTYEVLVNGKQQCYVTGTTCVVPVLLSGRDQVTVRAWGFEGTTTLSTKPGMAVVSATPVAAFAVPKVQLGAKTVASVVAAAKKIAAAGFAAVTINIAVGAKEKRTEVQARAKALAAKLRAGGVREVNVVLTVATAAQVKAAARTKAQPSHTMRLTVR